MPVANILSLAYTPYLPPPSPFYLIYLCSDRILFCIYRDFRPTSMEKGQELFRLRIYQAYAWGVPFIITSVAAILDILPVGANDAFVTPRFGKKKCWFAG